MKTKLLLGIFFFLFLTKSTCQETLDFNRISGTIKVPIIVEETISNDDFKYDQFDKTDIYTDKKYEINTSLHDIPVTFYPSGNGFSGTLISKDEYYKFISSIHVEGYIDPKTNLGLIKITESLTKNDEYNELNFKTEYRYDYLKVSKGITDNKKGTGFIFLLSKTSRATVSKYINFEKTQTNRSASIHKLEFLKLDEEKLTECRNSSFPCFNFTVYWDGKTIDDLLTESTKITQVRGEDLSWEPPSISYLRENIETEPNSIAIYYDYEGLDETSRTLTKGMSALIIADLSKVPGLKILERAKIKEIIQEINLSDSGLVKEESKVTNKLMKEEVAVIFKIDFTNKILNCSIQSKKKEIAIKYTNFEPRDIYKLQKYLSQLILKEENEQFNLGVNPNIIFNDGNIK